MVNGMDFNKKNNFNNYDLSAYKQDNDAYLKELEIKMNEKDKRIADLEGKMDTMKNEIDWLRSIVTSDMKSFKEESYHKSPLKVALGNNSNSPLESGSLKNDEDMNKFVSNTNGEVGKESAGIKHKPNKFKFAFKLKKGTNKLAA